MKDNSFLRLTRLAQHDLAGACLLPTRLKLVFAKSIPIVVTFIWTSPIVKWLV